MSAMRQREDALIARALAILERRLRRPASKPHLIDGPGAVLHYLSLKLARLEREIFVAIFLDAAHRPIGHEVLFQGTLRHVSVFPREIARAALRRNAAAVVVAHNHPSGIAKFSEADEAMTKEVREALYTVDVKLLDHIVVAKDAIESWALNEAAAERAARDEQRGAQAAHRARVSAGAKAAWARRRAARCAPERVPGAIK